MQYVIKGKLKDSGKSPSRYLVEAYADVKLGKDPQLAKDISRDDGTFKLEFDKTILENFLNQEPNVYLKISNLAGNKKFRTPVLKNPKQIGNKGEQGTNGPLTGSESEQDKFETVVVGSGFGGTIIALTKVNKFLDDKKKNPSEKAKRVCILERGQWWVSHEMPGSPEFRTFGKKLTLREYLEKNDLPYRTWAYPDNENGLLELLESVRILDRGGLYDYRAFETVHTLAASGVGGGSLVYTNVTEKPDDFIVDRWKSDLQLRDLGSKEMVPYFEAARAFIGVNKITTTSSIGTFKLARTEAFQHAAEKLRQKNPNIIVNDTRKDLNNNPILDENGNPLIDYDAYLSITDLPQRKDVASIFKEAIQDNQGNDSLSTQTVRSNIQNNAQFQEHLTEFLRKYATETNACQRQGRCALGCIPGARHTLNKVIYQAIETKSEHIEVRPLCEAYDIEPLKPSTRASTSSTNTNEYLYRIYYSQTTADSIQDSVSLNNGDLTVDYKFSKQTDKEKSIICKELFVSAGSIGSTELLLKSISSSRSNGDKLILSPRLGKGFSTNGDLLGIVRPTKNNVATSRGPIVTSAIRFRDENRNLVYTIEDSGVPKMIEPLLNLMLHTTDDFNKTLDNNSEQEIAKWISTRVKTFRMFLVDQSLEGLRDFTKNMATIKAWNDVLRGIKIPFLGFPSLPNQPLTDVVLLSGMGSDSSDGEIKLADTWHPKDANAINIIFDLDKQKQLFTQMIDSMKGLAGDMGLNGSNSLVIPLYDPDNTARNNTVVVHPLGGCCIGKDRSTGVVNDLGQVFKGDGTNNQSTYPGLYVVDGAIVPTALGVNSSLTIAALAFRIAKECTQDDIQNPKYLPVEAFTVNNEIRYMAK